jgi:hypothetical protein
MYVEITWFNLDGEKLTLCFENWVCQLPREGERMSCPHELKERDEGTDWFVRSIYYEMIQCTDKDWESPTVYMQVHEEEK